MVVGSGTALVKDQPGRPRDFRAGPIGCKPPACGNGPSGRPSPTREEPHGKKHLARPDPGPARRPRTGHRHPVPGRAHPSDHELCVSATPTTPPTCSRSKRRATSTPAWATPPPTVLERRLAALHRRPGLPVHGLGHGRDLLRRGRHHRQPARTSSRGSNLYGGSHTLFEHTLKRFGIETRFVDSSDPANFAAAIDADTRLVYTESIGNPPLQRGRLVGHRRRGPRRRHSVRARQHRGRAADPQSVRNRRRHRGLFPDQDHRRPRHGHRRGHRRRGRQIRLGRQRQISGDHRTRTPTLPRRQFLGHAVFTLEGGTPCSAFCTKIRTGLHARHRRHARHP